jgi:uncharacterized protein
MALSRGNPPKLSIAASIWLACAIGFTLAAAWLGWKLVFGEDYRAQALKDVQRVEFDVVYEGGSARPQNLVGETLSLETALAMSEAAQTVTPDGEPTPPAPQEQPEPAQEPAATETPAVDTPAETSEPAEPAQPNPAESPEPAQQPEPAEPAVDPTAIPVDQTPDIPTEPQQSAATTTEPTTETPPAVEAPAEPEPQGPQLAPVEELAEDGAILPAIAEDGTKPWRYFAKKDYAKSGKRPRIAVVIGGLGLSSSITESAIALPQEVTLSFSPYGRTATAAFAEQARIAGHEIMLDLPMETERYPAIDPGPYGIRKDSSASENHDHLMAVMSKARGYVGLLATERDVVTLDRNLTAPLIDGFAERGLLFVSGYSQQPEGMFRLVRPAGVPILFTDVAIERLITESHIRNQLATAEDIARARGKALLVATPYPLVMELLGDWTRELAAKGFTLVPVSALGEEAMKQQ